MQKSGAPLMEHHFLSMGFYALEVASLNVPPQACSLQVCVAKCWECILVHDTLDTWVCWNPWNTADDVAILQAAVAIIRVKYREQLWIACTAQLCPSL